MPLSPVTIAVTPLSFNQRNRRCSSDRMRAGFGRQLNSESMVSSTTRFAPMLSMACPSRMNRPSRLKLPPSSTSSGSNTTQSITIFRLETIDCTSNPKECMFCATSRGLSSKVISTPGSSNSAIPRYKNSMASIDLPVPAPPHTSVARPVGRPPPVIVSSPLMPVKDLHKASLDREAAALAGLGC